VIRTDSCKVSIWFRNSRSQLAICNC